MPDRPIIFSAPMVRALLDGRKTQTRRLLPTAHPRHPQHNQIRMDVLTYDRQRPEAWYWDGVHDRVGASYPIPYAPGDRLYVREAIDKASDRDGVFYRADYDAENPGGSAGLGWRPSIHMPRWASRITLTVTEVRVQRLQNISEADARDEGVDWEVDNFGFLPTSGLAHASRSFRAGFARLWNSLHGSDAWAANPWVVAVSFTVERRNIDA